MIDIDVKTLFIFSAIANIFIISLFVTYIKLYKVKNPFIRIFILSRVLGIIFLIMLSIRGNLPRPLSVLIISTVNLFIVFYELYCISFIERKFDKKHFKKFLLIPALFSIISYFFITTSESNRISFLSFSVAIMYASTAYILITQKGKTKIQHITGYIFVLVCLMLLTRAVGAQLTVGVKMYSTNYLLALPLVFFLVLNIIIPLLLLFILKEKDNLNLSELNKSKDKFFSIIAHDLRGPFGGLQQIGELLWLNNISDEKREKLTNTLYQNSKNTFNLLDNLLKWANSNTGLIVYKPSIINLHEVLLNNKHLFNAQVKLKNIQFSCDLDKDIFVFADLDMMNTIIRNLISNAVKFTPNGGEIKITVDKFDKINNICTVVIADSGVGIDKDSQSKIFEIDSTLSTLGTNKENGTGLGLKLCKEFLTVNKGNIWMESEENKGTRVHFSLPIENK